MVKFIKIIILPIDNYKKVKKMSLLGAAYSLYEKFINHIRYL